MITGKVLITGGAGTLGKAFIHMAHERGWDCEITIYSTDTMKHSVVRRVYPDVRAIVGDIRDYTNLYNAIAGHDMVIHAAAVKHIPVSENNPSDTYSVNVVGSENVAHACVQAGVKTCVGISTDKACCPHNAYGCTKMMNEKLFQQIQEIQNITKFFLVRYGNVAESTGSVIQIWNSLYSQGEPIKVVDESMTRFWLSPFDAINVIIGALTYSRPGLIYVPKLFSLSIGELADYTVPKAERETIPMRAGEKTHETLITREEMRLTDERENYYLVYPTILHHLYVESMCKHPEAPFMSLNADRLSRNGLMRILDDAEYLESIYD